MEQQDRPIRMVRRELLRLIVSAGGVSLAGPFLAACNGKAASPKLPGLQPPGRPEARTASAPGVTPDIITLGSIFALSGQASGYAPVVQTVDAYFKKVNDDGGVNGRAITFLVEDDQFSPAKSLPLAKKLIEQDRAFALVGNLGTATSAAVIDYTTEQHVPLLFVLSGSDIWGDYQRYPYAMGLQIPYSGEGRIFGRYVTKAWPGKKVGILYQNDEFGRSYLACKETLGAANPTVGEESHEAATKDLSQQVKNLRAKGAEVLALGTTARAGGLALKAAADLGWKPNVIMCAVAAVPSLFGLAGGAANVEGAVSDNWARAYDDPGLEVSAVKDLLTQYAPQVPFAQLAVTGYIIAVLVVESLKRAGTNPTRESLVAAAESFRNFRVPQLPLGSEVSTSKTDHTPIKSVQPTRAVNGRFAPFSDLISWV